MPGAAQKRKSRRSWKGRGGGCPAGTQGQTEQQVPELPLCSLETAMGADKGTLERKDREGAAQRDRKVLGNHCSTLGKYHRKTVTYCHTQQAKRKWGLDMPLDRLWWRVCAGRLGWCETRHSPSHPHHSRNRVSLPAPWSRVQWPSRVSTFTTTRPSHFLHCSEWQPRGKR